LGGNALLRSGQSGSFEEQDANFQPAARKIADLVHDYRVVVTHGNGPQVGYILLKNEIAKKYAPPFPIDACGAQTQGWIGYMIQQSLKSTNPGLDRLYDPTILKKYTGGKKGG
jgi:carbamate kinase